MTLRRFTFHATWLEQGEAVPHQVTVEETSRGRARLRARELFADMGGYAPGSRIPIAWVSDHVDEELAR